MPSLFTRFKRSPSTSSHSTNSNNRRSSTASGSLPPLDPDDGASPSRTVQSPVLRSPEQSASTFVEDFDGLPTRSDRSHLSASPQPGPQGKRSSSTGLPPALSIPEPLGTPKLVLTAEGSNSPRSVKSGSAFSGSPSPEPVRRPRSPFGLGISSPLADLGYSDEDMPREMETHSRPHSATLPSAALAPALDEPPTSSSKSLNVITDRRARADSVASARNSLVLDGRVDAQSSSRRSSVSKKEKKKRKHRGMSGSSGVSGHTHMIASALAKSGLQIAVPATDPSLLTSSTRSAKTSAPSTGRSPFLSRNGDDGDSHGDGDSFGGDDDDSGSEYNGHLPVTGFAVASNRRNQEFHGLFGAVDEGDYLIDDYGCALAKDILVQGRLYISENHICFHANLFGWVTDLVIPFTDIKSIDKKMTAIVIPNAIGIVTSKEKFTFASFISRDTTYDVMMNIWRLCNPGAVMSSMSLPVGRSRANSAASDVGNVTAAGPTTGKGHAKTTCACGRDGKHYPETAMDTIFASSPEKIYNLMFTSEWYKTFLLENQKLKDIEIGDWKPKEEPPLLMRNMTYIKPLNGSIGPKQTKCHIVDEQDHFDLDDYVSVVTTTRTPDVPSGSVFSVKTRTCLMWAGSNSTKVVVTTHVEWTGKSWVKGIIEKSSMDGQRQYHGDLEKGIQTYIKEHKSEFAGADGIQDEPDVAEPTVKQTAAEAYAAEQKSKSQKTLPRGQSSLDSFTSGLKAVGTTLQDVGSMLGISKEAFLGAVIAFLVMSNIYTYFAYRPDPAARARRVARVGGDLSDTDVAETLRLLLRDVGGNGIARKAFRGEIREEANVLDQILSQVERRAADLRLAVQSAVQEAGGLDMDLD